MMTTPQPPAPRLLDYIQSWPTVVFAGLVLAFFAGLFSLADPTGQAVLLGILGMVGTAGAAVMRAAFGAPPQQPPKRIEVARRDDDDDDGDAGGEVLADDDGPPTKPLRPTRVTQATMLREGATRGMLDDAMRKIRIGPSVVAIALVCLVGCSPSALQTHATTALIARHTLEIAHSTIVTTCTALAHGCADDACLTARESDCAAAASAQGAAVTAVLVYADAIELAALADEGRVMEALRFALAMAARTWAEAGQRLATIGIALPTIGGGF